MLPDSGKENTTVYILRSGETDIALLPDSEVSVYNVLQEPGISEPLLSIARGGEFYPTVTFNGREFVLDTLFDCNDELFYGNAGLAGIARVNLYFPGTSTPTGARMLSFPLETSDRQECSLNVRRLSTAESENPKYSFHVSGGNLGAFKLAYASE